MSLAFDRGDLPALPGTFPGDLWREPPTIAAASAAIVGEADPPLLDPRRTELDAAPAAAKRRFWRGPVGSLLLHLLPLLALISWVRPPLPVPPPIPVQLVIEKPPPPPPPPPAPAEPKQAAKPPPPPPPTNRASDDMGEVGPANAEKGSATTPPTKGQPQPAEPPAQTEAADAPPQSEPPTPEPPKPEPPKPEPPKPEPPKPEPTQTAAAEPAPAPPTTPRTTSPAIPPATPPPPATQPAAADPTPPSQAAAAEQPPTPPLSEPHLVAPPIQVAAADPPVPPIETPQFPPVDLPPERPTPPPKPKPAPRQAAAHFLDQQGLELPLPLHPERAVPASARYPGPAASRDEYCAYALTLTLQHLNLLPLSLLGARHGDTYVTIRLRADGSIVSATVSKGSGYLDVDERVAQMVMAVGRFPPLPAWLPGPVADFTFHLHYPHPAER